MFVLLVLVPDSPPLNVSGYAINETAITLNWLPIPEDDRNGILLGLNVTLYIEGSVVKAVRVVNSSQQSLEIHGLEAWTNYSVLMIGYTAIGPGPSSEIYVETEEEGLFVHLFVVVHKVM